jgi:hypothetical protein
VEIPPEPPKRLKGDWKHALVRAGIAAVPWVGSPAVEMLSQVLIPPIEERRDEWLKGLAEAILRLEEKVEAFKVESLRDSPVFVTAFLQASQVAVRSHQREKLDALRNAVLNVALGNTPDEDLQLMFISWIEVFTPAHLQVLRLFESPSSFQADRTSFAQQRALSDQVVHDLDIRGLIQDHRPYVARNRESSNALVSLAWTVSELGRQFLTFILSPAQLERKSESDTNR